MKNKLYIYIIILLAYAFLSVLHTYPMILHLYTKTPISANSVSMVALFLEHCVSFFEEHPFDLYEAFSPTTSAPLKYSSFLIGTSLGKSFVMAPFYLTTRNIHFSINMSILILLTFSAFSFFFLAKYLLNNCRAAFLGGIVFSFTSANMFFFKDSMCFNMVFFPLIFLFFFRFINEGNKQDLYITSILFALQFYSYPYFFIYAFYLLFFLVIIYWKIIFRAKYLPTIFWSTILLIILILPLALPYIIARYEYNVSSSNYEFDIGACLSIFSFLGKDWINVSPNNILYGKFFQNSYCYKSWVCPSTLFPGIIILLLIVLGFFKKPSKLFPRTFLVLLIIIMFFSSTKLKVVPCSIDMFNVPFLMPFLGKILPFVYLMRTPYRFLVLINFAGALLASSGYLLLEKIASEKFLFKNKALFLFSLIIFINIENLSIPIKLRNFDNNFGPAESDIWMKKNNVPENNDELIFHIPAFLRTSKRNFNDIYKHFEDSGMPTFRHLYNRHPIANAYLSYLPKGFIPEPSKLLPKEIAQKYLKAIGVKIVVVHSELLFGDYIEQFSKQNMIKHGFVHIKSFKNGDHIYSLDQKIKKTANLFLFPEFSGNTLRTFVITNEYYKSMKTGESIDVNDTKFFWLNPKTCKQQKIKIKIMDDSGRTYVRNISYNLPLVIGKEKIQAFKWDIEYAGIKGPFSLISMEIKENYISQIPDHKNKWKLLYK